LALDIYVVVTLLGKENAKKYIQAVVDTCKKTLLSPSARERVESFEIVDENNDDEYVDEADIEGPMLAESACAVLDVLIKCQVSEAVDTNI